MTEVEKEYWAEATRSGMERGMEQGMAKGSDMKLISMVCRKLQKGKEPEEIAEDLEEEFERVERICKVAGENSAGYDVDMIYQALQLEMVQILIGKERLFEKNIFSVGVTCAP